MPTKAVVHVHSYDLSNDHFDITIVQDDREDFDCAVPGEVLAELVGECGEPEEFLQRAFNVELPDPVTN